MISRPFGRLALLAWLLGPGAAAGQERPSGLEILPLEEEVRIALSAAPAHLREGAGVYALTAEGFRQTRESTNGFTCVVNRDHPLNRKPVCYDAEGTATILPKVLFVGERLLRGESLEEIGKEVQARFDSGDFVSPRRPGIAYMLTDEIRNYNPATGQVGTFPPHIMFYAPDLTNADIGADPGARQEKPWLPFVGYQGPQGFMIVVVGEADPGKG